MNSVQLIFPTLEPKELLRVTTLAEWLWADQSQEASGMAVQRGLGSPIRAALLGYLSTQSREFLIDLSLLLAIGQRHSPAIGERLESLRLSEALMITTSEVGAEHVLLRMPIGEHLREGLRLICDVQCGEPQTVDH